MSFFMSHQSRATLICDSPSLGNEVGEVVVKSDVVVSAKVTLL